MKRLIATAFAAVLGVSGAVAEELPDQMIWSSYDLGSSGHADASAIADALMSAEETRVRILPSGTSIGRLLPLKIGRVDFGFLANEVYFATEAIYDFASREWGPQDLRILLGRPATFGMATSSDSGITDMAQLEGRRVAYVQGNPSVNVKVDAMLAFGGLTRDDVEVFEAPSYGASIRALIEGQVDAVGGVPSSALFREMEASPAGLSWIPIPADNEAGWDGLRSVASFFAPTQATVGAALSAEAPVELIAYRYPMITVYADADEETVYALTRAVIEQFDSFKDARATMPLWTVGLSGVPPADAPFHPGAIRYLTEIGVWSDAHQQWNDARLARLEDVRAAWDAASASAFDEGISDADWPAYWAERQPASAE